MYRTYQIRIKKGHRFFPYCDDICFNAKNLFNTTNFYIRQIFTAFNSEQKHELQKEILESIDIHLPEMNQIKIDYVEKRKRKELEKPKEKRKEIKEAVLFEKPTQKKNFVGYGFLDALFKISGQADYLILPGQVNQQVMRVVFQNWKSFFNSAKDYKKNPNKYTGAPKLPKYAPKYGRKLGAKGKLQQVRIIPNFGEYTIELVMDISEYKETIELNKNNVMGIDLGVNCLATIVDNTGLRPVIIKGKTIKSINQYYNKIRAYLFSALRHGKDPKEGSYTSKRLNRLDWIRLAKIKDYFHKASYLIVKTAVERKISKIIIGKNNGWKENVEMKKNDKQNFMFLPYSMLIKMITYKAERFGIEVIEHEESYTSQASLLDMDPVPTFKKGEKNEVLFSGKRISRGRYQTKEKKILHADVNAAGNIIRKVVPNAFANGIEGIVACPLMLSIVR